MEEDEVEGEEESVFQDAAGGYSGIFQHGFQFFFRAKAHVVADRPVFSRQFQDPVEQFFGKVVQKGDFCVHLYGKVSVGGADIEGLAGAVDFFQEMHLGIPAADVLKNGI